MQMIFRIFFKLEKILRVERLKQIKKELKSCGKEVILEPSCHIFVPQRLEIGDHTSVSSYTVIYATFGVKIGKNCLISSNCGISSYNHIQLSFNRHRDRSEDDRFSKAVKIGDNVWIGMNSCILPGVEIGENSIIGSGSVVTKNIPANELWAGNPARFLKKLEFNLSATSTQNDIDNHSHLQSFREAIHMP